MFRTQLFGTVVTPNLTPDKATGIGRWSRTDFAAAMRWGIAPDDTHYLPLFPFPHYNRLTDRDLDDLWTFLRSLKPARRPDFERRAARDLGARPRRGGGRRDPDAGLLAARS